MLPRLDELGARRGGIEINVRGLARGAVRVNALILVRPSYSVEKSTA